MTSTSGHPDKPSRNSVAQTLQERLDDGCMYEEVYEVVVSSVDIEEGEPIAQMEATEAIQIYTVTADVTVTVSWTAQLSPAQVHDLLDHLDETFPTASSTLGTDKQELTCRARVFVKHGTRVLSVPAISTPGAPSIRLS